MKVVSGLSNNTHPNKGHRERLRKRFLQSGFSGFLDYEIIELLLTLGTPRKDCKQLAKELVNKFGSLRNVLDATLDELREVKGIGPSNFIGLKLFQAVSEKYAREKIPSKISLSSLQEVVAYLKEKIGKEKKENFIALLIDSNNKLITINNISIGTPDSSLVHPREVFEPAIRQLASSIILAHNHPSGNSEPSIEDIKVTQRLSNVGEITGINILDHIIISSSEFTSLKIKGLL